MRVLYNLRIVAFQVSENFYVDMNSEGLKRMLGGHIAYSDASTLARSCVLSISKPSPDLFLVVRLEKVLQGDISECAEPYLRDDKNKDKVMPELRVSFNDLFLFFFFLFIIASFILPAGQSCRCRCVRTFGPL